MCPFVNKTDARCGAHLTLGNLAQAFAHCADCYTDCPIYRELSGKLTGNADNNDRAKTAASFLAAS